MFILILILIIMILITVFTYLVILGASKCKSQAEREFEDKEQIKYLDNYKTEARKVKREICRGDIFYANLEGAVGSEQRGVRPVVIVQNNIGNKLANTVIVVPISKKLDRRTKLPMHTTIKAFGNIKWDSTILTEQIRVLDKSRLLRKIGKLPHNVEQAMNKALQVAIDIKE